MTSSNNLPDLIRYNANLSPVEIRSNPDRYPRIKSFAYEEAVQRMTAIVWAAALYRNQELSDDKIRFIAGTLVGEILADTKYGMRNLSWEEIGLAVRAVVLGDGREMYGISVASLYAALLDYVRGDGHEADKRANQ